MDPIAQVWHDAGMRAPGEGVFDHGEDITDTVHPDQWPTFNRRVFYELGWRPWTPPGVEPVWWSVTEQREATAAPIILADQQGVYAGGLRELAREARRR